MAHFSVLLVMDAVEDYEYILAPYGEDNQDFYEFVDDTDEVKETFMKLRKMYLHPDGSITPKTHIDDSWWSRITEEEYIALTNIALTKCKYNGVAKALSLRSDYDPQSEERSYQKATLPENVTEIMSSYSAAAAQSGTSFKDWACRYYGFGDEHIRIDPETNKTMYGYLTNPQAKWDWYTIGGRWSNMLIAKNEDGKLRRCDMCRVGDLDLGAMHQEYVESRKKTYNVAVAELLVDNSNAIEVKHKYGYTEGISLEQYLSDTTDKYFIVHAVVVNGVWYDRGDSIWGGLGEDGIKNWDKECVNLLESLAPEKWIAIIDCHV